MVDYSEDADFSRQKKPKKYLSWDEQQQQRRKRNSQRTDEQWRAFARDVVYRQLGIAERSEYQLLQTLQQRDVPTEIARETLAKFISAGLVDDSRFAQMYVRSVFHAKSISVRNLKLELKKRGISDEIIEKALQQIDADCELQSAIDYAARKIQRMQGMEQEVIRRRLYGQLARRGFAPGQVRKALNTAFAEIAPDRD
ncbi:regulatory protein RecX [Arcanobacterium hippocoleae]